MRTVGYARVSSREQAENSCALEQQIARLQKEGGANEILYDVASGSKDDRPNFKKLLTLVREGVIHRVIVSRLDRLSRSVPTIRKTVDEFEKFGVEFVSLGERIDTSTSIGKFQINLLASLAEMEVDRLSERVQHGWQHFRDKAKAFNPPFGYKKVGDRFELDHTEFLCLTENNKTMTKAQIARDIIAIFFAVKSLRGTIREINTKYGIARFNYDKGGGFIVRGVFRWSPGGLSNWLKNPVLLGHTCYLKKKNNQQLDQSQWNIHYDTHPDHKVITEQESSEIASILSNNERLRGFGTSQQRHPLAGLVYCSECRSTHYSQTGSRGKTPGYNYYFQCKNSTLKACPQKKMIRMEVVEDAVVKALTARANEMIDDTLDTQKLLVPNQRLHELQQQLKGLESLGFNPALEQAKREIKNQIKNIEKQQELSVKERFANRDLLIQVFSNPDFWHSIPDLKEKTRIIQELVTAVWVRDGKIQDIVLAD